jgi:hypothetical protein
MLSVRPPGIQESWDDNNIWDIASMISFANIRMKEDSDFENAKLKALVQSRGA